MNFQDRKKAIEKHRKLALKNQELIDSHPFVKQKTVLINKHKDSIKNLLDSCTHDEVVHKEQYYDGSYYDKAETRHWDECVLCHKTLNHRTETHSYYG